MDSERLKRIMDVLGYLATSGPQTVTEVSNALEIPVSSTHDLLKGMIGAGMASATNKGYDIGPVTARLAFKISRRLDLAEVAAPDLERLLREVGFDVYLAVQTGNEVIYASRFRGRNGVNIDIPLGIPLFRHATAAGKLFAAYNSDIRRDLLNSRLTRLTARTCIDKPILQRELKTIRDRGISVSREEAVLGIVGIAAPILFDGEIVGAAHISALRSQLDSKRLAEVSGRLRIAVRRIEARLEGQPLDSEPVTEPLSVAEVSVLRTGT